MSKKVYAKPPKTIFVAQVIIIPLFMIFGLFPLFVAPREIIVFLIIFVLIWEAGCMAILVNAVKVLKRIQNGNIEVAEISGSAEAENDFSKKLRDLKALKVDGLLSDDEYREKREEILKAKW